MVPIAVVLLVLVVAFTLFVGVNSLHPVALNREGTIDLALFGLRIPVDEFGLFCCGAGAMLALVIAVLLLRSGVRRTRAARREKKTLLRAATGQARTTTDRKAPSTHVLPGRAGDASRTATRRDSGNAPTSSGSTQTAGSAAAASIDPEAPSSTPPARR